MTGEARRALRILLADGEEERLDVVGRVVARLGHVVIAKATDIAVVATLTEHDPPDVAIVVVGESGSQALDLIRTIVREATCPAIVLLRVEDPAFVDQAAALGVFAAIADISTSDAQLGGAIAVVLRRFAEYHDLQGAFGRRALTERAKGILMERHGVEEQAAFAMLREQSRHGGRKLIDVAQAVLDAQAILPRSMSPSVESAENRSGRPGEGTGTLA